MSTLNKLTLTPEEATFENNSGNTYLKLYNNAVNITFSNFERFKIDPETHDDFPCIMQNIKKGNKLYNVLYQICDNMNINVGTNTIDKIFDDNNIISNSMSPEDFDNYMVNLYNYNMFIGISRINYVIYSDNVISNNLTDINKITMKLIDNHCINYIKVWQFNNFKYERVLLENNELNNILYKTGNFPNVQSATEYIKEKFNKSKLNAHAVEWVPT